MVLSDYQINKKQIIFLLIFLILLLGLVISIYLVQRQQVFKSKATVNMLNAFEIKDDKGNIINCTPAVGDQPPICETGSLNINIKVKDVNSLVP